MAIRNVAGEPDGITKDPQCRHNETLFVTYSVALGVTTAACSNCGSTAPGSNRENARNALMRIEAPPLTGGGFTP